MPSIAGGATLVLDRSSLDRLRETLGDQEGLREILHEFVVASGRLVQQMAVARRRGRTPEVERAAHTLKSMARLVGAKELAEACRRVEFLAHGAAARPVPAPLVAAIAAYAKDAQEAVQRLLR